MAGEQIWPIVVNTIQKAGVSVLAAYGPMLGGVILNPATAADQNLPFGENIYVDLTAPAQLFQTGTTVIVPPGGTFPIPAGFPGRVYVNAVSAGHRFGGLIYQEPANFKPSLSPFSPSGPTSLTAALPMYLYQEYNDDDDLLAFVDSYNKIIQGYMDWFTDTELPVYTTLTGQMLDWVAAGLYGMMRPSLPFGRIQTLGPLNTVTPNSIPLNELEILGPQSYYLTNDDLFKRCMTWYLWKGDGKQFNIRWLKRRVMRWLTGTNGTAGMTDETYPVSVTFGPGGQIDINIQSIFRYSTGGALLNVGTPNSFYCNEFETSAYSIPPSPYASQFKAAVQAGVLKFPFQLTPVVNI